MAKKSVTIYGSIQNPVKPLTMAQLAAKKKAAEKKKGGSKNGKR